MPQSVTSAFSEPEDFYAAMCASGFLSLLVTARGQFRALLTRISLNDISLSAAEEWLPRIAFVAVPADRAGDTISGSEIGSRYRGRITSGLFEVPGG